MADNQMRLEIEVSRSGASPVPVVLTAREDNTVGTCLDALGAHLGLEGAQGAIQARSLISGRWLERTSRLDTAGVLRGERLSISVGLDPGGLPDRLVRWSTPRVGDHAGTVAVNRPPRSVGPEPQGSVSIPPYRKPRKPRRFSWGAMLVPILIGGLLYWVTRRWEIALFSLFSPVMVIWNYFEEKSSAKRELREHGTTYAEDVETTTQRITGLRDHWTTWMRWHHPSPIEISQMVLSGDTRVWERQPGDPDFLALRLGRASRTAPIDLRTDGGGLRLPPEMTQYEAATGVDDVPVVAPLAEDGLAIVAGSAEIDKAADWLVLQLAALHSPADVQIVVAAESSMAERWQWLPHIARDTASHAVATNRMDAATLLEAVTRHIHHQRELRESRSGVTDDHVLIVILDGRLGIDPVLIHEVANAADVGVVVLFLVADTRQVPAGVGRVLTVFPGFVGAELIAHRGGERVILTPEFITRSTMIDLVDALSPLRDAADAGRARTIPDRLSLEELLDDLASPVSLRRRWENAPQDRLIARLGQGADGEVHLDLGPEGSHALVGGTTGSGKSELLQAMVASLAAEYPPDRVGFLLVDYKGGAAFKDAMHLPHCVGVVTDLDEHLTRRVMRALDAEIRRRELVLAKHDARDLVELRRLDPQAAPGELIVIVDEFATLAKEIPEFVEGVVDIAARGRSLGLRLVLATQRPAGVINDRIRANIGARIALRVNDEADSQDVIGAREAAHIPRERPGRAYLKVHRDIVAFQGAYVGGPVRRSRTTAVEVDSLWGASAGTGVGPNRASGTEAKAPQATVLEALVSGTHQVLRSVGRWEKPHVPWLPAMPGVLTTADLTDRLSGVRRGSVVLGLADLPQHQAQQVVVFDLEQHRSLLVFGTSRSGKTTVLRTLAAGFLSTHGPDEVQVFGMDFSGHGLRVLEDAPQCPGVVGADEPGRLARLLRHLAATVAERKQAMGMSGAADFGELARHSAVPLPRLLVLVDGYAGATAVLERLDGGRLIQTFERLIADGPAAGVHFVLTADRRAAVPNAVTSSVTSRLVLRMADRDDYALLGVDSALTKGASPERGRGFLQGDTEIQVGVLADSDSRAELDALTDLVAEAARRWPQPAPALGRMPGRVEPGQLPTATHPWVLPVGIGDARVLPVSADLREGHFLIAGPPRSGRTNALAQLADATTHMSDPPALAYLGTRRTRLAERDWEVMSIDGVDQEDVRRWVEEVRRLLILGRPVLCLIDDADTLPDAASMLLEELARSWHEQPVRLVVAADNRWALRAYSGLVPEIRKSKSGLLLAPDIDLDGDLVGVRLRPPLEPPGGIGRGFLARDGVAELIQVGLAPSLTGNPIAQPHH